MLTVLLGDKKGRKTLLYVTGITLVITFLPLILVLGLFGWMAGGGTDNMITPGAVYNELPNEIQVELTRHEEAFERIEQMFSEAGLSSADISKAKTIFASALAEKAEDEAFFSDYMACFLDVENNNELLSNISSAFGVVFSEADKEDFEKLYGGNE